MWVLGVVFYSGGGIGWLRVPSAISGI